MEKQMKKMLIGVGLLFGSIFLYKGVMGFLIKKAMTNRLRVAYVSTTKAHHDWWEPRLTFSGSLRAIRGVDVTTELAGMVKEIYFTPGSSVKDNELLVQLNIDSETAQLSALEANADLAKITYLRDKAQYAVHAVSQQNVDNDTAQLKNLKAQVAQQAAIIAKKTIRAPFSGFLGINYINLGQYLNPGDKITTLQTLDPIYVDFYVPQQSMDHVKVGQMVDMITDTFPNMVFQGKVTTVNPAVYVSTRNVQVQATVENPQHKLIPGMFTQVEVVLGQPERCITVPQTAIAFNSYGDVVYVVQPTEKRDKEGHVFFKATQRFITTGSARGDEIKILKGLNEGEEVITSGQMKLKNNSLVLINNTLPIPNNPDPHLPNDH